MGFVDCFQNRIVFYTKKIGNATQKKYQIARIHIPSSLEESLLFLRHHFVCPIAEEALVYLALKQVSRMAILT